ncbi:NIPA-like protein 3, partial [Rhizoclosmatium sp. JEL0117]
MSLLIIVAALVQLSLCADVPCRSTSDCAAATGLLGSNGVSAFVCIANVCQVAVAAGYVCSKASDCAQYQWVQAKLQSSPSLNSSYILGSLGYTAANGNVTQYLDNLCHPSYCTIASTCSKDSTALFNPSNPLTLPTYSPGVACCAGGLEHATCTTYGTTSISISTCANSAKCVGNPDYGLQDLFCTGNILSENTLWIGIFICILGSGCSSVGLNLQALATRNRKKKKLELLNSLRAMRRQQQVERRGKPRSFFSTFTLRRSPPVPTTLSADDAENASIPLTVVYPPPNTPQGPHLDEPPADTDTLQDVRPHVHVESIVGRDVVGGGQHISSYALTANSAPGTMASTSFVTEVPGSVSGLSVEDEEEEAEAEARRQMPSSDSLQKKLNFGELVRNPIWILGFIIFASAQLLNFAALQFAPQSLVAPLGSISLVVNVVAAPLINKEKYSWKDIVGGIFIIGGSSMTVVFAGVNSADYNLCILLKLFQKPATIVFLTLTSGLLVAIFCFICTVEKNIESSTSTSHRSEITEDVALDGNALVVQTTTTTTTVRKNGELVNERRRSQVLVYTNHIYNGNEKLGGTDGFIVASDHIGVNDGTAIEGLVSSRVAGVDVKENNFAQSSSMATLSAHPQVPPPPSDGGSLVIEDDAESRETELVAAVMDGKLKNSWWARFKRNLFEALPLSIQSVLQTIKNVKLVPRFRRKIPMSSKIVSMGLPLAYASLGGIMGTLTTLFAKSTIHLLTNSFVGDNQFNQFQAWLIAGVTAFTAVGQIYWINMGLERYDALLQIPVFFVVWTVFDVVGGGIYFNEFEGFSAQKYALFCLAIA